MKLMLRPEWRLWPLSSFLGITDIKTGVTLGLIFTLLNKVAGVYGLIAMLTGAGGSFAQLSLYIYSVFALALLVWGLLSVQREDAQHTLYFAHAFFADHIFSTSWTVYFAVDWWYWEPHDGTALPPSPAQKAIIEVANLTAVALTPEQRAEAAAAIWDHEKGKAAAIIVIAWLCKLYFIALIYSFASHLRKGSYRSLPHTRGAYAPSHPTHPTNTYEALAANEDDNDLKDAYRLPLHSPSGHRRGRSSRKKGGLPNGGTKDRRIDEEADVLFDEDETAYAASTSSRGHSKLGTDSTAVTSDEERGDLGAKGKGKRY
ncbi:Inositolphosphorylceramide synthase subunit Kei1-domain-containing protein [Coprinopsis sp. MPI-PUGE-AT-0042]|nr:Inositolphosphorylceramide synthase subunit Kei1-domain-containing protein [Coprinopsis sp. MPI-PUGE-AT-0042]